MTVLSKTDAGGQPVWSVFDAPQTDFQTTRTATNLAGEPRHSLMLSDLSSREKTRVDGDVAEEFLLRGALARSLLIVGAIDRALAISVEYAAVREQFGRPLAKFQAVQALVADIASEAAIVHAAVDAAVALVEREGFTHPRAGFAVAVAKSTASRAATISARNAHQVLGAIGFTYEHELHRHTNRMLSWRSEFGTVRHWDDRLTELALAAGSAGLWALISD
ncbi:acyl-CoA dehydrogenase family protein [Gordonia sp. DT30]|uniref:acyl-CoA dehydrogenase family protein n=1 Tax=Gordonia sp. DT30 TaxID=3416546 RepID=UPI003CEA1FDE